MSLDGGHISHLSKQNIIITKISKRLSKAFDRRIFPDGGGTNLLARFCQWHIKNRLIPSPAFVQRLSTLCQDFDGLDWKMLNFWQAHPQQFMQYVSLSSQYQKVSRGKRPAGEHLGRTLPAAHKHTLYTNQWVIKARLLFFPLTPFMCFLHSSHSLWDESRQWFKR